MSGQSLHVLMNFFLQLWLWVIKWQATLYGLFGSRKFSSTILVLLDSSIILTWDRLTGEKSDNNTNTDETQRKLSDSLQNRILTSSVIFRQNRTLGGSGLGLQRGGIHMEKKSKCWTQMFAGSFRDNLISNLQVDSDLYASLGCPTAPSPYLLSSLVRALNKKIFLSLLFLKNDPTLN